jgi:hypothetical protein
MRVARNAPETSKRHKGDIEFDGDTPFFGREK